ncbi:MAG: hypothetical protein ACRDDH_19850, partial [Cetobacterium sp.]|uniref:hypothetical protein n=1 Tax=Cetobacterium sp. TaxID=2071632 RepID=UPI003EE58922
MNKRKSLFEYCTANSEEDLNFKTIDELYDRSLSEVEVNAAYKNYLEDYERIENEFRKITKLDKLDVKFLFFATALQCLRQYLISNSKLRFDDAEKGDAFVKRIVPRQYQDILLQSVPYDATQKSEINKGINLGIAGNNHRVTTLGHDPLLGWIFGTLNIMTNTLTKNDIMLSSHIVNKHPTTGNPIYIGESIFIGEVLKSSYEIIMEDKKMLPVCILRQALHFGSDNFTKMGLPLPVLNTVAPDISKDLMKNFQIDFYSVTRGIALSSIINLLIANIHALYYDEEKYKKKEIYEVKTRKILLLSNTISSVSNIVYTSITKDFEKLDVGGILVTIYRLISDTKFINNIKKEFVENKINEELEKQLKELNLETEKLLDELNY